VPPLAPSQLAADLRRLGVEPGALLMVHASLRAIGPVEDGARGVVAALDAAVGAQGTLLMVLGAADDWAWVNTRPESERAALLAEAVPFDPATTPAEPELGVLAEIFRRTPGTIVSDHPEGRFAARGASAEVLLRDVPWDDYYGPGSPLERLVERGGRVLRLGADTNTTTLIHFAEYLADIAHKRRVRRHRRVLGARGPEIRVVECLDDSNGIVDFPGEDYFSLILRDYLASRSVPTGRVGRAACELLDGRDLVEFAAAWMTSRLGSFRREPA
jgi:aminoglycoside N3'-acetyltransferase